MPKQITKTVYEYSELSERAKERARNWFIEGMDGQFEWECLKDDAEMVGLLLHGTDRDRMTGAFKNDARHTVDAILANHGEPCETYKTASRYKKELDALAWTQEKEDADEWNEEAYQEMAEDFLTEILEDYRIMYEKNLEYQQSEEAIAEAMEINGYTFDENGRRDG